MDGCSCGVFNQEIRGNPAYPPFVVEVIGCVHIDGRRASNGIAFRTGREDQPKRCVAFWEGANVYAGDDPDAALASIQDEAQP